MPNTRSTIRRCPPTRNPEAKIAIIGDIPTPEEVGRGEPFIGWSGDLLDKCLYSAGILRSEVYLTHVIKELPIAGDISLFQ